VNAVKTRVSNARPASPPWRWRDRGWIPTAHATAVLCLLGSAVIHGAVIRAHFAEWWAAGVTFIVLASLEAGVAAGLVARPSRLLYLSGIWLSQLTIALWALSRTIGIPFGPDPFTPEPVGRPDVTATILEAITWAVLTPRFLARPERVEWRGANRGTAAVAIAVAASVAFALLSPRSDSETQSHARPSLTGPIVPIDGHSLLSRSTPPARVLAGQSVGIVVGQLRNASDSDVVVRSARLIGPGAAGIGGVARRFWLVSPAAAQPGEAIDLERLRGVGIPLPSRLPVEPYARTGAMPLLVLELDAMPSGEFVISALRLAYESNGRTFDPPYATNAKVIVTEGGDTHG
jgi:hypothetical protein